MVLEWENSNSGSDKTEIYIDKVHFTTWLEKNKKIVPIDASKKTSRSIFLLPEWNENLCYMWHLTHDTWHMTHGMWHVIYDRWGEVNLLSMFQLPNSYNLGVKLFSRYFHKFSENKPKTIDPLFLGPFGCYSLRRLRDTVSPVWGIQKHFV